MPREDRGEENREARRVEGVRRDGVTARRLELAGRREGPSPREGRSPSVPAATATRGRSSSAERGPRRSSGRLRQPTKRASRRRSSPSRRAPPQAAQDRGLFCSLSHRSGDVKGLRRSCRIGDLLRRVNGRRSEGRRRERECDRRSGLHGPVFPLRRNAGRDPRRCVSGIRGRRRGPLFPLFPLRRKIHRRRLRIDGRRRNGCRRSRGSGNLPDFFSERLDFPFQQRDALRVARDALPQPRTEAERRESGQERKEDHVSGPRQAAALLGAKIRS